MKIIFLCSSLELGKDGVGDYTRRLAGELIRQGHKISIIALHDRHINNIQQEYQIDQNLKINTLRLSSCISWNKRVEIAKEYVDEFNPDWLSLQFVPYGFHEKGMPFCLAKRLLKIGCHRKWHIMLHELWIGENSLKSYMIGNFQKYIIMYLINQLAPHVIHTHLPIYFEKLLKIGLSPKKLPLFSNIPNYFRNVPKNDIFFRISFFSQSELNASIFDFLKCISEQLEQKNVISEILFIGGDEKKQKKLGIVLESIPYFKGKVKYTGYLDNFKISRLLWDTSLGITPVPFHALGKSGSVAAFLHHRVPVAVVDIVEKYKQFSPFFCDSLTKSLLLEPSLEILKQNQPTKDSIIDFLDINNICFLFISDLSNSVR